MTLERAMELLNALIDNALVGEKQKDVIMHLMHVGFEERELINNFNFSSTDVREAAEDMKYYEEE